MEEQSKVFKSEKRISVPKKKMLFFVVVLLFFGALAGFVWSFTNYQNLKKQLANVSTLEGQQEITRIEIEQLLASVSQHIILPDEEPTVATIQDIDALVGEQPVFEGAENGDKVIVYSDRAIIYSPTKDLLVKVVPVFLQNVGEATQGGDEAAAQDVPQDENISTQSQSIRLDIRNGSQTSGAAQIFSDRFNNDSAYEVVSITNAAHFNYEDTILINATGAGITALEQELGVSAIFSLPENEQLTDADVIIIIGN